MTALVISNVILWVIVLALVLVVLALSRQIGVLYERVAPMGALTMDKGPQVGDAAPVMELQDLRGRAVTVGVAGPRSQLIFLHVAYLPGVQEALAHSEVHSGLGRSVGRYCAGQ